MECEYPFLYKNCTRPLSDKYATDLYISQAFFLLLWIIIGSLYIRAFLNIKDSKVKVHTYKKSVYLMGIVVFLLMMIEWIAQTSYGFFSYKITNVIDEVCTWLIFCMALTMVDFWASMSKITYKLHMGGGMPIIEKNTYIILAFILVVVCSIIAIFHFEYGNLYYTVKFIGVGILILIFDMRSSYFIYQIDKNINKSKGKNQIRIKFSIFLLVSVIFGILSIFLGIDNILNLKTWQYPPKVSNDILDEIGMFGILDPIALIVIYMQFEAMMCRKSFTYSQTKSTTVSSSVSLGRSLPSTPRESIKFNDSIKNLSTNSDSIRFIDVTPKNSDNTLKHGSVNVDHLFMVNQSSYKSN